MPRVPSVTPENYSAPQVPSVINIDASPIARGGQDVAEGVAQAGGVIMDIAQQIHQRKQRDEAQSLVEGWQSERMNAWDGRPGTAPGEQPVRGIKDWGEGDGSAVQAMTNAWKAWRDNPDGLYAKSSAGARKLADLHLKSDTDRMFSLAAQKDMAVDDSRRRTAATAALATSERATQTYAIDDNLFAGAAQEAAVAAAKLKLGRMITNPDELDPDKLQFATEDGRKLYNAIHAETLDKLRHGRALTLAQSAGTAENEAIAEIRIAMASKATENLPSDMKADALSVLDAVRAKRLDGMLGAAIAEKDLDKQERLISIAENAAKRYGSSGKILGAVTEEAEKIRTDAQRTENKSALAALVEGRDYQPGENTRMQDALKWAQTKFESMKKAEASAARSEQSRALTSNKAFIGAMIGAGAWVDGNGNLKAVTVDERRELLRAQLAAGNIRIADYQQQKDKLDSIEKSGQKAHYERTAKEVCAALGSEIKTLWTGSETKLAEKEDPSRKITSYTFDEAKRELVPETQTVTAYRGGTLFGGSVTQSLPTGRLIEKESLVRQKRDLLASDVTKVIDLLMSAENADGLMLDLDGNPSTPAVRMDARSYKTRLLSDVKSRQLSIDLDTQSAIIAAALSAYRRDQNILEATAIRKNAGMKLPDETTQNTQSQTGSENGD